MSRSMSITLTPKQGSLHRLIAFVDDENVILGDGDAEASWEGEVSDSHVTVQVVVIGIGSARYEISLDLPGDENDASMTRKLKNGSDHFKMVT